MRVQSSVHFKALVSELFFLQNLNICYPSKMAALGAFFDPRVPNSLFYSFFGKSWPKIRIFHVFLHIVSNFCIIYIILSIVLIKNNITLKTA